jgi:hypothetical protein
MPLFLGSYLLAFALILARAFQMRPTLISMLLADELSFIGLRAHFLDYWVGRLTNKLLSNKYFYTRLSGICRWIFCGFGLWECFSFEV